MTEKPNDRGIMKIEVYYDDKGTTMTEEYYDRNYCKEMKQQKSDIHL